MLTVAWDDIWKKGWNIDRINIYKFDVVAKARYYISEAEDCVIIV